MDQQQDHNAHLVGHHRHRGRKEHHHLRVRGQWGRCFGGHHGHKHHGRNGICHGHRHGLGNGHGFVLVQEQIEQMVVAHVIGGEQPAEPENSEQGEMIHHHHCHRHYHRQGHCHHPHRHHCHQVTGERAPNNELSGVMVRMSLEDEPKE